MKAQATYTISKRSEIIDLNDYDLDDGQKFEDLPEADKRDIEDILRDEVVVYVDVKTIPD